MSLDKVSGSEQLSKTMYNGMGTKAKTKVCLNKVDLTRKQNKTKQNGERGTPGKNDVHYFRWLKNSPKEFQNLVL